MALAPAPATNLRGFTAQPEEFRKTGITYVIGNDPCLIDNCGMFYYTATYQGRDWQACYFCKVKRYVVGIEAGQRVWSGYSVMV